MKLSASLLLALAAAPFAMGLKADQLDEGSVLRRTKGGNDDDYTHPTGDYPTTYYEYSGKVSTCCDCWLLLKFGNCQVSFLEASLVIMLTRRSLFLLLGQRQG